MGCNFEKLLKNNRVKAIGIPWSNDELNAMYNLKIPADYVRQGILTKADYEKELKGDIKAEEKGEEKPLIKMTKEELVKTAKELGLDFDEGLASRGDLMSEISTKRKNAKSTKKNKIKGGAKSKRNI